MNQGDFKAEILKQEIELLVRRLDHFDNLRHRTKQMAATLWLAAIGAALTLPSKPLIWLALVIPAPFWFFDAQYHAYQEAFQRRFWAIRAFIRDGKFTTPGGEVLLGKFLVGPGSEASDSPTFPVPDYYGNKTFDEKALKKWTGLARNARTVKMLLFYGSLALATGLLLLAFKWLHLSGMRH